MRAAISLLVLLFSMCGVQTRSTQTEVQTESQGTGAAVAAAEVSTQLDVSVELKELRDMVVELRTTVLEADNAAVKTRLTAAETEVMNLKKENGQLKTRLAATETEVENLSKEIQPAPKVAFSAGLATGYTEAGSDDLNLVFSRVITNVGEAYSSTTGFFTAPARGVYYFRFTVRDNLNSRTMQIRMYKNKQQLMMLQTYDNDGHSEYLSSGLTLQLEKGDTVNMVIPRGFRLYDDSDNDSTFSGFLLFPL